MRHFKWDGLKDPKGDLLTKRIHGRWDLVWSDASMHPQPIRAPLTKEGWVLYCPSLNDTPTRIVLGAIDRPRAIKKAEQIIAKAEGYYEKRS